MQHIAAFRMQTVQTVLNDLVRIRVENAKGNILHFIAHQLHAHAACQRRIYIHGFFGNSRPLFGLHMM